MPDEFVSGQTLRRYVLMITSPKKGFPWIVAENIAERPELEILIPFNKTFSVIPVIGQR